MESQDLVQNLFDYHTKQGYVIYKATIKPEFGDTIEVNPYSIDEKRWNWEAEFRGNHVAYGSGEILSLERLPSLKSICEAGHEYLKTLLFSATYLLEESQRPSEKK